VAGLLIKIGVAYTAVDRAMADAGLAEDLEVSSPASDFCDPHRAITGRFADDASPSLLLTQSRHRRLTIIALQLNP